MAHACVCNVSQNMIVPVCRGQHYVTRIECTPSSTSSRNTPKRRHTSNSTAGQRKLSGQLRSFARATRIKASTNPNMRESGDLKGSAWVSNGVLLAAGGALPGLLLASNWQQVCDLGPLYQALALFLVDAAFIATATGFLSSGDKFGVQRYGDTPPYPGPFIEKDGKSSPPAFFKAYVVSTPLSLGIFVPIASLGYLVWHGQAYLGACTIGVYLLEVAAQLISEGQYIKQKTAMWPQVPQVYQTYRIWQLIRGCFLVGQFGGPSWLWYLQAMLILLWTFNFGAVMTWTPWMYRWHLQPEDAPEGAREEVASVLRRGSSKNK